MAPDDDTSSTVEGSQIIIDEGREARRSLRSLTTTYPAWKADESVIKYLALEDLRDNAEEVFRGSKDASNLGYRGDARSQRASPGSILAACRLDKSRRDAQRVRVKLEQSSEPPVPAEFSMTPSQPQQQQHQELLPPPTVAQNFESTTASGDTASNSTMQTKDIYLAEVPQDISFQEFRSSPLCQGCRRDIRQKCTEQMMSAATKVEHSQDSKKLRKKDSKGLSARP